MTKSRLIVAMLGALFLAGGASHQRTEPGDQLGERERLDKIVIAPRVQPLHPVSHAAEVGQEENGPVVAADAQPSCHG